MKKTISSLIILNVFFFLLPCLSKATISELVVTELMTNRLITNEYDRFLNEFFKAANENGDLPYNFNVNKYSKHSYINIFVLESDLKGLYRDFKSLNMPFADLLSNCICISPNTIIVGELFLADILLTIYNDWLYLMQALDLQSKGENDQIQKFYIMANYLRYRNISNSLAYSSPEHHSTILAPKIAEKIVEMIVSKNEIYDKIQPIEIHYNGLLFIFSHEVEHLKKNKSGGFVNIREILNRFLKTKALAEEIIADKRARETVKKSIERNPFILSVSSIMSVGNYLRDYINVSIFEKLRKIDSSELFFTFIQKKCERNKLGPYGNRVDNMEFVEDGYWKILPVMSYEEYAYVQKFFKRNKYLATHEHNFFRSEKILTDLRNLDLNLPHSPITPFTTFYKSVLLDQPYIDSNSVQGLTNIGKKDLISLLNRFDSEIKLYDSPSCGDSLSCNTGTFLKGHFDIISANNLIKYANIYFPIKRMHYGTGIGKNDISKFASETAFYKDFMLMSSTTTEQNNKDIKTYMDEYFSIRTDVLSCGFYSKRHRFKKAVVEVSTIRTGTWIRFEIFSNEIDRPKINRVIKNPKD